MDESIDLSSKKTMIDAEEGVLSALLKDSMRMASYAVEVGRLPEQVKFAELYRLWDLKIEQSKSLTADDINKLESYYRLLEEELEPVNAVSLYATDARRDSSNSKNYMNTEAGKHARRVWRMAFSILALIMGINLFQYVFDMLSSDWAVKMPEGFVYITILYWLSAGITPFAYGAFGACVRLLRVTERRLRDRSFDPRRIPEHNNRLVLGTLSGGVIVLLYSSGGVGETDVMLTEAALGFLAGYSIDLLFSIIDRMVNALSLEKTNTAPIKKKSSARSFGLVQQTDVATKNRESKEELKKSQSDVAPIASVQADDNPQKTTITKVN